MHIEAFHVPNADSDATSDPLSSIDLSLIQHRPSNLDQPVLLRFIAQKWEALAYDFRLAFCDGTPH